MLKRLLFPLLTVISTGSTLAAPDGKTLYTTYCSACHGADGVGAEGNPNPPLAGSEWLTGKADRAIAAVLHGLVGPIEVKGRLYNLAMPPQGAMIQSDAELAAVLTYVRSNFGNKQKAVSEGEVAAIRKATADRKGPWTATELRLAYPMPARYGWPRLKNLRSTVYKGKFEEMPNFKQLEAAAYEEEPRNLVDVAHAGMDKEFAIVWEGELISSKEGDYNAILAAKDGARLFINDKELVTVEGVGEMNNERTRRKRFRMTKGSNKFRLEHFNNQGNPALVMQIIGATGRVYLSESRLAIKDSAPPIMLDPAAKFSRTQIYRNFIKGSRPKSIGVGYAGGVNQTFAINYAGSDLIWHGKFIDAGRHWTNRGQGYQPPAGEGVTKLLSSPAYAILPEAGSAWPGTAQNDLEIDYLGYDLTSEGTISLMSPVFQVETGGVKITDFATPAINADDASAIQRTLTVTIPDGGAPEGLHFSPANAGNITGSDGKYIIDGKVLCDVEGATLTGTSHLAIPLDQLTPGEHNIVVTYTWLE